MALVTSLVVLFYCCATADILTKLLQQCFLIFIVVPLLYLGNSQVSVYRTIGPTLVIDSDPRFPPFLLYVRWKSGVTFVRRCFRDACDEGLV